MQRNDIHAIQFDHLLKEIKLLIFSLLSNQDLCTVSLLSKTNDALACHVWNEKAKTDFYFNTTHLHPKLFYQRAMGYTQELNLLVTWRKAEVIDAFLESHFEGEIFTRNKFFHCIRMETSLLPFLEEVKTRFNEIKSMENDTHDFHLDVKYFLDQIKQAEKEGKNHYANLLNNPDEKNSLELHQELEQLCMLDAYHTIDAICKKTTHTIDYHSLLIHACFNFNVNSVRKFIELGIDINKQIFIPGDDDRPDQMGPLLIRLLFLMPNLFDIPRDASQAVVDRFNNARCYQKIISIFQLLLQHGADPDQLAYRTQDRGVTQMEGGISARTYCERFKEMLSDETLRCPAEKINEMIEEICQMIIDHPKKEMLRMKH